MKTKSRYLIELERVMKSDAPFDKRKLDRAAARDLAFTNRLIRKLKNLTRKVE